MLAPLDHQLRLQALDIVLAHDAGPRRRDPDLAFGVENRLSIQLAANLVVGPAPAGGLQPGQVLDVDAGRVRERTPGFGCRDQHGASLCEEGRSVPALRRHS